MNAACRPTTAARACSSRSRQRVLAVRASAASGSAPLKVVVTGAAGRTGGLILQKLLKRQQQFEPRAVVRGEKSKGKLLSLGAKEDAIFYADVSAGSPAAFAKAFEGADAVIIATSGVPQLKPLSLIKVFWAKLTGQQGVGPDFTWKEGQKPEQVDWLGQKAQVDAAKAAGVKHVLVVGSMGGTQTDNRLNDLGEGNILRWKRKGEQYLVASGLTYTIIHPGGLLDDKGGERRVVLDVDDKLLANATARSIPREDVAELTVQCLTLPQAKNRAFDCVAMKLEEGQSATSDWAGLIDSLGGANCDYSIHSQLELTGVA